MNEDQLLLEVENLRTYFFLDEGTVRAVDGADFQIGRGRTLGVVGESGCGKSVTAQSILRIVPPPGRIVEGEMVFHRLLQGDGSSTSQMVALVDLTALDPRGREIRSIRGAEIAMVFQEPMTSLSSVHTIGSQIVEAITLHQEVSKAEAREKAIEMLDRVGMPEPSQTMDSYPHQLSGGMRQRGMTAMALSCNPSLLIADEPTTALDVTTEAQILELMRDLQQELGMAIMYITHDLGVIAEMAEVVVVMYMGKVVERAETEELFMNPKHPYTEALMSAVPKSDSRARSERIALAGEVANPAKPPSGCYSHPRCRYAEEVCRVEEPSLREISSEHFVSCHRAEELSLAGVV